MINLQELVLYDNQLTGSIPDTIGQLINLQVLYLFNNQLTGSIPDTIGQLINLQQLYLYNNQLTGSIPDLSGLKSLGSLTLGDNQLTGSIPNLSGLKSLVYLDLHNNQLTGSIPNLSGLKSLVELAIFNNQLTGSIPDLSGLESLVYLNLRDNQLTGSIPDLSGLTISVWLYNNQLTGSIPDLSGLNDLQNLALYNNQLTGSIPNLSGLTSLEYLDLERNQLTGSIPDLSGLTSLQYLYVNNNQLSGSIPGNLPSRAFLSDNEFTGQIPPSLALQTRSTNQPLTLSGNYLDLTNVDPAIQVKIDEGKIEAALQWEPNKKPELISKIWSSNSYLKAPNSMVTYRNYLYIADVEKGTISKINKRNPKQRTDAWWDFGDAARPVQWSIKLYEYFIYVYSPSSDIIKINLKNDESETWFNLTALTALIQESKTNVNPAGDLVLDFNMRSMSGGFMYQLGRYTDTSVPPQRQVFVEKINLTDVSSHETVHTFPFNDPDTILCGIGFAGVYGVLVDSECLFIMTLNKVTKVNLNTSSVSSLNVPANMNTCWGDLAELVVLEKFLYIPSPMTRTILKINLEEFDKYAGESNAFKMLSDQSGPFTVFTEGLLAEFGYVGGDENMAFTTDGKFFYIYNNDGNIVRTTTRGVPTSNICFPAGTPIKTDQGLVAIEKINTDFHTIDKQRIVDVTKTKTSDAFLVKFKKHALAKNYPSEDTVMSQKHKVLYKGKMCEAKSFLGAGFKVKKVSYNGEVLYNVLLDKHGVMGVNGMVCETLHPEHVIAKLFSKKSKYSVDQREDILSYLDMCRKKNFSRRYRNIIKNC